MPDANQTILGTATSAGVIQPAKPSVVVPKKGAVTAPANLPAAEYSHAHHRPPFYAVDAEKAK